MQIRIFTIPVSDPEKGISEMNAFLNTHKLLDVEQHLVTDGIRSFWSFCIRYIDATENGQSNGIKAKIDYKQVLNEKHFAVFSRLREIRKELASKDAVPAFAVFTDEELAQISRLEAITCETIKSIKGIGEKRIEKYGKDLVSAYNET